MMLWWPASNKMPRGPPICHRKDEEEEEYGSRTLHDLGEEGDSNPTRK